MQVVWGGGSAVSDGSGFQCDNFAKLKRGARMGTGLGTRGRQGDSFTQKRAARRCSGTCHCATVMLGSGCALKAGRRRQPELGQMGHKARWASPFVVLVWIEIS
jgi:hypothetical protein